MVISVFRDYEELSAKTADFIAEFINNKPDALLCLPAGHTSLGTFRYLVEYGQKGIVDFGRCRFVGLDEWIGLKEYDDSSCKGFMYKNLFLPLGIDPQNIVFFDADADGLEMECNRIDKYISEAGPIDLMLLGVGMNGHLGLNEPGASFDLYSHVTELDSVTKTVGQKYFDKPVMLEKGITLGLKHVLEAHTVILQASEKKKAEIIKRTVKDPVSPQIPSGVLRLHDNALLFLDAEAASLQG